jgi:NAD(P)-dependent dehydrogenase (short-subunit alcohol dehydrogenase family)
MPTAVVTGATKGIGAAIATALARCGYDIVGVARSGKDLEATRAEIEREGVRFTGHPVDLADPDATEDLADRLASGGDDIAVLVNNAGAGVGPRDLVDTSPEDLRRIMRLNVVAPYVLVRALAPRLAASGRGRVVNIGSAAGSHRMPPHTTSAAYAAAKGAVAGLTRQTARLLRLLAGQGIAVNAVLPGDVLTEAGREWFDGLTDEERAVVLARVPRGALTTSEEVAHAVAALCAPDAGGTVGAAVEVNSGAWIR